MNILPGWFPAGAVISAPAPTLASRATATDDDNDDDVVIPASVEPGDLLLLIQYGFDNSVPSIPSGFTNIHSNINDNIQHHVSYRIAQAGDAGSVLTTGSATISEQCAAALAAFSGEISSVAVRDINSTGSSTNPPSQTTNSSAGTVPLIAFGLLGTTSIGFIDATFSPTEDGSVTDTGLTDSLSTAGYAARIYWKIYNVGDTPQDITVDQGNSGDENRVFAFYIEAS